MEHTTVGDLYDACTTSFGSSVALRQGQREVTYRELREQAHRLAAGLAGLSITKGDRVAFLMSNCVEYVFTEYGLALIGGVRVPLAVALGSDDHIYMMNHSEARVLVYHEKLADRVTAMIPSLVTIETFVCVADVPATVPEGHVHLQTLADEHDPVPPSVNVTAADLVGIYYTGGTTGRPKGVMLSHRAWVNSVLLEMLDLGLERNEVFAYMTPLTHAAGVLLLPVLLRHGTAVILDGFDPEVFFHETEQQGITASMFVPTMIYLMLDHPRIDDYDLTSLRTLLYGAAPMSPDRLKQAVRRFGPIFAQFYGQTEAPMMLTSLQKEEHVVLDAARERAIFASCGRPTVTTQIRLLDGDGNEVADGEVGEIVARAINVMDGYFKDPETTATTLRDGWLHTGDMARRDYEGFLSIVDRAKDMIVSGGFNVYPREVEDALFSHPDVQGAAVIGVPDDKWGEAVKAIVVLQEGASVAEEDLIAWVKERKGSVHAPKSVEFRDTIPLTNLGKLDKKKLRADYWEGRERQV
jgi:acyl-CoA synthetase (AMP-forming)/AMP-acid ligase II